MSTIGILPTTPTPFPSTAPDPGEFLNLSFSFPDEDPLGLTTLSSNTNSFSWNGEPNRPPPGLNAESNWVDQRPINAQLRNGQPTPPEDKDFNLINTTTTGDDTTTTTSTSTTTATGYAPTAAASRPKQKPRKSQGGGGKTRREKSLERNRVAASKCRQKKKEHTAHLESRFKAQWQKKAQLESELSSLRCQILGLKNEVLKHAHCGDGRVGEHLSQMMQQITTQPHPTGPAPEPGRESENEEEHARAEGVSPPPHLPPPLALDLEEAMPDLLEQEMRRESQASLSSDASYTLSMEENFDDLINV